MAKDDNLPTRVGKTQGHVIESRLLESAGGASSVATRQMVNPADGTTTILRTRGGSPEFVTSDPDEVVTEEPGIFAYSYTAYLPYDTGAYNASNFTGFPVLFARAAPTRAYKGRGDDQDEPTIPGRIVDLSTANADGYQTFRLAGSDGKGRWVGFAQQQRGSAEVNYDVLSGSGATYATQYSINVADTVISDVVASAIQIQNVAHFLGQCRGESGRIDYTLETFSTQPTAAYTFTTEGGSVEYQLFKRFKLKVHTESGGSFSHVTDDSLPLVAGRSYYFAGATFLGPEKLVIAAFERGPYGVVVAGGSEVITGAVSASYRTVLLVRDSGGWSLLDISTIMASAMYFSTSDGSVGVSAPSVGDNGLQMVPTGDSSLVVGTTGWYYVDILAGDYRLSTHRVDLSTGSVSSLTTFPFTATVAAGAGRQLRLWPLAKHTWAQEIVSGAREVWGATASAPYQLERDLKLTTDNGASFTAMPQYFYYGFEAVLATERRKAGDLSAVAIIAAASGSKPGGIPAYRVMAYRVSDTFEKIKQTADFVGGRVIFTSPVSFCYLGSRSAPADINPIYPWLRDARRKAPSWWST